MREKGKVNVPDECSFAVSGNVRAPMSMKTGDWVVSIEGVYTNRSHSISIGGLFICCEFLYGAAIP